MSPIAERKVITDAANLIQKEIGSFYVIVNVKKVVFYDTIPHNAESYEKAPLRASSRIHFIGQDLQPVRTEIIDPLCIRLLLTHGSQMKFFSHEEALNFVKFLKEHPHFEKSFELQADFLKPQREYEKTEFSYHVMRIAETVEEFAQ
jgi:hypothetical protein